MDGQHPVLPEGRAADGTERTRIDDFKAIARMQTSILFDSVRAKGICPDDIFRHAVARGGYAKASRKRPTTLLLLSDMMTRRRT